MAYPRIKWAFIGLLLIWSAPSVEPSCTGGTAVVQYASNVPTIPLSATTPLNANYIGAPGQIDITGKALSAGATAVIPTGSASPINLQLSSNITGASGTINSSYYQGPLDPLLQLSGCTYTAPLQPATGTCTSVGICRCTAASYPSNTVAFQMTEITIQPWQCGSPSANGVTCTVAAAVTPSTTPAAAATLCQSYGKCPAIGFDVSPGTSLSGKSIQSYIGAVGATLNGGTPFTKSGVLLTAAVLKTTQTNNLYQGPLDSTLTFFGCTYYPGNCLTTAGYSTPASPATAADLCSCTSVTQGGFPPSTTVTSLPVLIQTAQCSQAATVGANSAGFVGCQAVDTTPGNSPCQSSNIVSVTNPASSSGSGSSSGSVVSSVINSTGSSNQSTPVSAVVTTTIGAATPTGGALGQAASVTLLLLLTTASQLLA